MTVPRNQIEARQASLLARGWPTATEIAAKSGMEQRGGVQWADKKRDEGQLLGAWSKEERTFRYPDFQFDLLGHVRNEVPQLLALMAQYPGWSVIEDPSGWRRTFWLYQPLRSLSRQVVAFRTGKLGPIPTDPEAAAAFLRANAVPPSGEESAPRSPAEVFISDPGVVVALVRDYVHDGRG